MLLLIPCAYATWQLRQAGSLVVFGTDVSQADPFRDPIRYLLPILTLTAAGLLASRFVPRLFGLLAALVSRIQPLTPIFLALRDLARSPGRRGQQGGAAHAQVRGGVAAGTAHRPAV